MYNPLSKSNFGKTFFILFLSLAFSCKKDSVQPAPAPTYPIEGVWTGTYTQDDLSKIRNMVILSQYIRMAL